MDSGFEETSHTLQCLIIIYNLYCKFYTLEILIHNDYIKPQITSLVTEGTALDS